MQNHEFVKYLMRDQTAYSPGPVKLHGLFLKYMAFNIALRRNKFKDIDVFEWLNYLTEANFSGILLFFKLKNVPVI